MSKFKSVSESGGDDHWAVSVSFRHDEILTIGSDFVSAKSELTSEEEEVARNCARHILSFLGEDK